MFSFLQSKNRNEAARHLAQICNQTAPVDKYAREDRTEKRYSRKIPTVVCPLIKDVIQLEQANVGLTEDISDHGVGLLLQEPPPECEQLLLGYCLPNSDEPKFFRAIVEHNTAIGGGYWMIGALVVELLEGGDAWQLEPLYELVWKLRPNSAD